MMKYLRIALVVLSISSIVRTVNASNNNHNDDEGCDSSRRYLKGPHDKEEESGGGIADQEKDRRTEAELFDDVGITPSIVGGMDVTPPRKYKVESIDTDHFLFIYYSSQHVYTAALTFTHHFTYHAYR